MIFENTCKQEAEGNNLEISVHVKVHDARPDDGEDDMDDDDMDDDDMDGV